jgi:hypothetical protein
MTSENIDALWLELIAACCELRVLGKSAAFHGALSSTDDGVLTVQ